MDWKKVTKVFLIALIVVTTVAITVYDLIAISQGGTEATISHLIVELSYQYPMLTWTAGFIPGVLVGHLFWRMRPTERTRELIDGLKR